MKENENKDGREKQKEKKSEIEKDVMERTSVKDKTSIFKSLMYAGVT